MKLVHFADLHLDAPFRWAGPGPGARRRLALRQALERVAGLVTDSGAGALLCGGDLFDSEHVSADTAAFARAVFAGLAPTPVLVAPGNHDWLSPGGPYLSAEWPANVHVFRSGTPEPVTLPGGVTVWGAGFTAPTRTEPFFAGSWRPGGPGLQLALLHGSESSSVPTFGEGREVHAPFNASELARAGLAHVFAGHLHRPEAASCHTYPGNPEPLEFGETGVRGAVVATLGEGGVREREWVRVGGDAWLDLRVDVTGAAGSREVCARVADAVGTHRGVARVALTGELGTEVALDRVLLEDATRGLDAFQLITGGVRPGYDLEGLAAEPTVTGRFVRGVLAAEMTDAVRRDVLLAGLRALSNRSDLELSVDPG
ncbi:MAG: metallophosphoesterase family protein [Candidatus Dormibacteria bacterium]